ncbi:MAG: HlyD family secretion protein [Gaiellaceae bacterium]
MAKIVSKMFSKQYRKWTIAVAAVLVAGFFGFRYVKARRSAVPKGIAWGNGRIEAKEVDIAAKLPLRVKEILVAEGDLVKPGQVVVRMDTVTIDAELAEAEASLAAAQEQLAVAKASIVKKSSEIELAKIEKARSGRLVAERAGSQRELDVRTMTVKTTTAALAEERAKLRVATEQVDVARANVAKVQSRITDATLTSPVLGRVLYRVAEPGEVLAAGGKALTLVNLEDVYMEIFLPSAEAAAIKVGADARLTVDFEPGRAAAGYVSFVSPEAQFTPKEVETRSEREKLMFRVKIQVPRELVLHYIERIKTGVRGVGYVKVKDSAVWPGWLEKNLVRASDLPRQEVLPPTAPSSTTQPR